MKRRKLKIIIGILVICIIIIIAIIGRLSKKSEVIYDMPSQISSIEELLKFYNCDNINIIESKEEQFKYDIYLTFGEDLWQKDGRSNEAYYNSIIINATDLLNYCSYRLIDDTRELLVAIIADSTERKVQKTYINGRADYFSSELTKKVANAYEEIKSREMKIQSQEIKELIENNWEPIEFGTLESRFENYDIYFDEGIEVKTLGGKVYNIIFTDKYSKNIINDIKVNDTKEKIIKILGEPSFENSNEIGYKGEEIYVFFSEDEVSIYRIDNGEDMEQFLKIWESFLEEKDIKKFVNAVTDMWTDYSSFLYNTDFVYLEYALKGLAIQFNVSTENGVILYNNFKGSFGEGIKLSNINSENIPQNVYLHTDTDLIFEKEVSRQEIKSYMRTEEYMGMINNQHKVDIYYEKEENGGKTEQKESYAFSNIDSKEFYLIYSYAENGVREVKFMSKTREYPDSELIRHKQIYMFGWINDEELLYSAKGEGIFIYNAKTRKLNTITTGTSTYEIKKVINNTVYYDDTSIRF